VSFGDEILAAGRATRMARERGQRVVILDKHGKPRWHPLWEGLEEEIASPRRVHIGLPTIVDGPSARPYLIYPIVNHRLVYREGWKVEPGALKLSPRELASVAPMKPFIFVEPSAYTTPNKCWPFERWAALRARFPDEQWVQPVQFKLGLLPAKS